MSKTKLLDRVWNSRDRKRVKKDLEDIWDDVKKKKNGREIWPRELTKRFGRKMEDIFSKE